MNYILLLRLLSPLLLLLRISTDFLYFIIELMVGLVLTFSFEWWHARSVSSNMLWNCIIFRRHVNFTAESFQN